MIHKGMVIKNSLCDYPGHVACVYFSKGCNMACPYCYNRISEEVSIADLMDYLKTRINKISGVVLSGGEFLENDVEDIKSLIRDIKYINNPQHSVFNIKLDTNGSHPDMLQQLLNDRLIDYVAMDIKTTPDNYVKFYSGDINAISESRNIIIQSGVDHEFRSVIVPELFTKEVAAELAKNWIPNSSKWRLSNFVSGNCLDPRFNNLSYSDTEINDIISEVKKYHENIL